VWPAALPDVKPAAASGAVDPETGEPLPEGVAEHLKAPLGALDEASLPKVLNAMSVQEYRKRTVLMLPAVAPDGAVALLRRVLLDPAPGTWTAAARALQRAGREEVIVAAAEQIVIKPQEYAIAYAAFLRARLTGQIAVLPERRDAEILAKAIQVLDALALQHKDVAEKSVREAQKATVDALRALLNEKSQRVLKRVIHEANEDEVRRILQSVRQSPAVTDTIRRATETFTADVFPALLASRDDKPEAGMVIFTTAEGRRRREKELQHLMEVEFEKVRLEIGRALEFGDISENAELDAARERQQRLADQASRMQLELQRAQLIDPAGVETESVNVGTRVTVTDLVTNEERHYTILGPWDLDESDASIVSHLSPMAQGLLGRKPDDVAKVKLPGGSEVQLRVLAIENAVLQET
jgi:transcription elongation factor GreA